MQPDQKIAKQYHMLSMKQTREQVQLGQSSQLTGVDGQLLDLDSLDNRSEERVKKPKASEAMETL